jgi:arylsulfatase A-like enzyme
VCARAPLLAIAVLAGLAACDAGSRSARPEETVLDLAALLPFTDDAPRTTEIRPGDPAARAHLLRGWSAPVRLDDGTSGARIVNGRMGTVVFHAGRKPYPITVRVERRLDGEAPPPRVGRTGRVRPRRSRMVIDVNGIVVRRAIESLHGPDGLYRVPVELVQAGRNVLTIRQGSPGTGPRGGPQPPRWVYTAIRFDGAGPALPAPRAEDGRLVLPAGSEATFYLRAPPEAALRFDLEAPPTAAAGLRLRASITPHGSPRRTVLDLAPRSAARVVQPLGLEAGTVARLTLAFGERGDTSGAAVALRAPEVVGRGGQPPGASGVARGSRPNVVLYLADTLRADRLGCYGRTPSFTPEIDRLAREGIVFEHAVAQSPWTRPSTATILTGRYPAAHGAITLRTNVRRDVPTLGDLLARDGWTTAAFVTNLNVAPAFGFGRGFATYEYLPEDVRRPGVYEPASVLHDRALAWLDAQPRAPFFLYLHATDPHAPYRPVGPEHAAAEERNAALNHALMKAPQRLDDAGLVTLQRLYDAETAQFDAELGRFRAGLAARGLTDDTLFVFVADHGEEFREHGAVQHGNTLYDEVMRIPLVVRLPGGSLAGTRVRTLARQIDLMPTMLALLDVAIPAELPGTPLALGDEGDGAGEAVFDTWFGDRALTALVLPGWKVVLPRLLLAAKPEVYDLRRDPEERHDVARAHPVLIGYAKQRIAEVEAGRGPLATDEAHEAGPQPEALDRLRALGYVLD